MSGNLVEKTINIPNEAILDDAVFAARKSGCKFVPYDCFEKATIIGTERQIKLFFKYYLYY